MPFTVTCSDDLRNELLDIWLQAPNREAVRDSSDRIDTLLKVYPEIADPDPDGIRRVTIPPLTLAYKLLPDDCMVIMLEWKYAEG